MKTLYFNTFCNAALEVMGKKTHSLDDEVNGDDLRAIAEMIDIAESRRKQIFEQSKLNVQDEIKRQLTIEQVCSENNVWFKVESIEQQEEFQNAFFNRGGFWMDGTIKTFISSEVKGYTLNCKKKLGLDTIYNPTYNPPNHEEICIIW